MGPLKMRVTSHSSVSSGTGILTLPVAPVFQECDSITPHSPSSDSSSDSSSSSDSTSSSDSSSDSSTGASVVGSGASVHSLVTGYSCIDSSSHGSASQYLNTTEVTLGASGF